MIVDLNKLYNDKVITIDEDVSFPEINEGLGLKAIKNAHVKGAIKFGALENLELNLLLTGKMILEDAITLEDVINDFNINIEDTFEENDEEIAKYLNKNQNTLDIQEILWQNIVLEVPIRARSNNKDVSLEGDGWQLNKETQEEIDPRLAPLQELIDEGKE